MTCEMLITMPLTIEEKKILLSTARASIEAHLAHKPAPVPDVKSPALLGKNGAFVSLHAKGRLRGCIGIFLSEGPLYETISEMAISAATKDDRFSPVTKEELTGIEIEISALTPLRKISDVKEIEVGRHGIYIIKGSKRGVLLPQVATEYGFDRETFLDQTCIKAGLKPGSWKDGADIYIFEAEIFKDENPAH
ncbi:MAG: AmmeMemoRadiSam system protein A [Thermodesulfobacteriota bacterium]